MTDRRAAFFSDAVENSLKPEAGMTTNTMIARTGGSWMRRVRAAR